MGLSEYKVAAGVAVSDMDRAREYYEGKLGLLVGIDSGDNVQYRCAEGTVMHVYLSPEHAGKSTATLAGWLGRRRRRGGCRRTHLKGRRLRALRRGADYHGREGHRHVRGRRQGRLLQGSGRQHPLDSPSAAFLSGSDAAPSSRDRLFTGCREVVFSETRI